MKIIRSKAFRADRAWGALDIATLREARCSRSSPLTGVNWD